MTAYRRKLVTVDAVQAQTVLAAGPGQFDQLPGWLRSLYNNGALGVSSNSLILMQPDGAKLAQASDWLLYSDADGGVSIVGDTAFSNIYEPNA